MTTKTNTNTRPANMVMTPEEAMVASLAALQRKCADRKVRVGKKGA